MNIQARTLAALQILISPLTCFSLLHEETKKPTTPTEHSIHRRIPLIRHLNDDGAAFSDDTSYFSNDDTPDQLPRLSTSTIIDANPYNGQEDNSVNVVGYLSRPNTLGSLANSINTILTTIPAIYDDDANVKIKKQERQDETVQVLNESVDLASFFGADAKPFPVFSYNYDTMPPTMNKQTESPAPKPEISSTSIASTASAEPTDDRAPTVAMAADDDLVINESMDSAPKIPTALPASSALPFSSSNENSSANTAASLHSNGLPVSRPQEQTIATNNDIAQAADEVVHSPSLRPSVSISAAMDHVDDAACFPPCKGTEEICRSGGKGGLGSCYPKCKSKKRCDYGDVCRSDGYCDRCQACKSFKKRECCSIDFEMCREVIPEKKIDQCFNKCTYNKDCNDVIPPNLNDVCLLDGGCARSKSKAQKYYTSKLEIAYKYADGKGRRMLGRDTDYYLVNERKAKIREKGASKSNTNRTVRRRRMPSNYIPA